MLKVKVPKVKLDEEPNTRERVFFAIAMVGLLFFFYNTLWTPKLDKIKLLKLEIRNVLLQADAIQRLIDATQQQLAKKTTDVKQKPDISEKVKNILQRKILDPTEEINDTLAFLNKLASFKRAKVTTIKSGEVMDKASYSVVPIAVELFGAYTPTIGYIGALEEVELPIVVDSVQIVSGDKDSSSLNAALTVNLYIPKLR